jgi:hypothetical protein
MWSTLALQLPLLLSLLPKGMAAPAAIPDGGVGVRTNDTPPVYAPMSDCELLGFALSSILADQTSRF